MMTKSKMTAVNIIAAVAVMIGYIVYICVCDVPAADDMKEWAKLILIFIGINVAVQIVTHIAGDAVFAASVAAKEKDKNIIKRIIRSETAEDEMDTDIALRSSHIGYGIVGGGFVITLVLIMLFDVSVMMLLNVLLMIFFVSSVIDSTVSICLRERGCCANVCGRREDE